MPIVERILMGPGPSNPYPEATEALGRPLLGHLDPDFLTILDETCDRLRTVFATANSLTLPVSGTGSAGMEAAFVNLVHPGDVVVVAVNGLFGQRMCDVATRAGGEVIAVETPWGQPIDPEAVLAAHPSPQLIAVVHAETSTGVVNDVAAVAADKGDALLLADCVTSLGGIPVDIDGWGIDVAYSGKVRQLLLERYGIEIGAGAGGWAGKAWRIGCMGHTARERNVTLLLSALADILGR
jgi:alanine-glyoxylate transaminase / serine-glyoxylate transaminase / serine-pyruvate transaminase